MQLFFWCGFLFVPKWYKQFFGWTWWPVCLWSRWSPLVSSTVRSYVLTLFNTLPILSFREMLRLVNDSTYFNCNDSKITYLLISFLSTECKVSPTVQLILPLFRRESGLCEIHYVIITYTFSPLWETQTFHNKWFNCTLDKSDSCVLCCYFDCFILCGFIPMGRYMLNVIFWA